MQVARQIALSTKVASRAYGAPFAKNPPRHSGFSGLLRLPPQSPNTQNSSAATPRSGADFEKLSFMYYSNDGKNGNEELCFLESKKSSRTATGRYSSA